MEKKSFQYLGKDRVRAIHHRKKRPAGSQLQAIRATRDLASRWQPCLESVAAKPADGAARNRFKSSHTH